MFFERRLQEDIGFGNSFAFQTLLVLTGITTEQELHLHKIPSELPNYYLNSFADFNQIFENLLEN